MVNQTDSLDSSWVNLGTEENQEIAKDRRYSGDSGIEEKEEFKVLDGKNQKIQANLCDTPSEDLSLENAILTNFPDSCDRSFTVESKDEDSYDIIPKNLTFAEIINILNQAVRGDNCEELDKVVQNIEDYEGRSITLDNVNLKSFCEQQLNLDLQGRSDHQHIYSNVLSQYKFDQENFECDYSVKELVLLAIAANDKLTERCQDILFAEGNLSLLPLLVGGQKYIEAFTEKFHSNDGVHGRLKDQAIQLVEPNKISFFSVIALRKEQELLNAIFVEYVLRDFGQVLKTSKPDPLYDVLETASLIKNEEFITIVLGAFERYINEPTKKASTEELLKKSFATLLETAISQEHISVIEYLCKRYTNSTGHAICDVYEQAFADDKVITILRQQILKNIGARGRREIYNLVLKTALDAGNIAFIEHLCKECAECSNDVIGYLNQKFKNNEFDNIQESILIALSNVEYTNTDVIVKVLSYTEEIYQNASHNEQVIRQIIQNILKNATHYSIGQEDYSLVKGVCYLCTEIDAINIIFREECGIFKSSIEKRIEGLEKENKLSQSEALREYNYRYLPGIVNGLAQTAYIAYDEYTKDPKDNKRQENTDLIFSLMQIRNILQFSIDVQKYSCHERQDLWDEMYQTPGTFIIRKRSNNAADELEIPVITSDILSENPAPKNQQPQENVERRENIMNNRRGSTEELISNSFEEGKMHSSDQNIKSIEEALSDAIFDLNYKKVESLVEQVKQEGNNVERIIDWALEKASETKVGKKDKESKDKIKKIREFLKGELTAASLVEASVGSIGATASGQEIHTVEFEESEPNSPSLSSEDDDYSKLEGDQNDKSSGTSSGSGSPFKEVVVTSEMPSMATEESKSEPDNLNDKQDDQQNLTVPTVSSSVSEDVLTSRSDEEESVVITQGSQNDGEHDKFMPEEHQDDDAMQNTQPKTLVVNSKPSNTGVEGDEKKQALVQPNVERIIDWALEKASETKVGKKDKESKDKIKKIREFLKGELTAASLVEASVGSIGATASGQEIHTVEFEESEPNSPSLSSEDDDYSKLEGDQNDKSSGTSSGSGSPFKEVVVTSEMPSMATEESKSEPDNLNDKQDDQQNLTVPTVSSSVSEDVLTSRSDEEESVVITQGSQNDGEHDKFMPEEHQDDDAMQNTQPKTLVVNSKPSNTGVEGDEKKQALVQPTEPVSKNAQGNSKQPSYPNKNNPNPQDAKSKLPAIAASMLAITGIATGIAIAVYLEMLAVGIAVGACCLVAAAIIYYCNKPSKSLENSNAEMVTSEEVKISCCT